MDKKIQEAGQLKNRQNAGEENLAMMNLLNLSKEIHQNQSAVLNDNIADNFSVSSQPVHRRFKLLGMTRKTDFFAFGKGRIKRMEFINKKNQRWT
jgi:hypothetical protein